MAKAELDVLFTEYNGHMDNMVYYTVWGKTYARRYVIPHNPKSEAQQAHRSLFAEAMAGWKLLSEDLKQLYRKKTRKLRMHAHNLFIKEYMKSHKHERSQKAASTLPPAQILLNSDITYSTQLHSPFEASLYGLRITELSGSILPAYTLNAPPF